MARAEEDVFAYIGLRPFTPRSVHWTARRSTDRCSIPQQHRAKLHSTSPIERLNGEIKRGTDVVGIFPSEAAIRRLVGAILMELTEAWAVQRSRYVTLETLAPVCDDPITSLPAAQTD